MSIIVEIAEWSILAFGLIVFLLQFGAHEIGYRLGSFHRRRQVGNPEAVGIVVGAMLALLAFVLALTLSFGNTRFNERRLGTLEEANAIGTAWLRAKAIGGVHGEEIAALLEKYAELRADFVRAGRDSGSIGRISQETSALQTRIWGHLSLVVRDQPNPVTNSLMTSLNETFDMSTAERFAFAIRLPNQIFWLLLLMTIFTMGCLGYQFGLREKSARLLASFLMIMWTVVVVDILDLASARLGHLRADASVYDWTMQGFRGGIPLPER